MGQRPWDLAIVVYCDHFRRMFVALLVVRSSSTFALACWRMQEAAEISSCASSFRVSAKRFSTTIYLRDIREKHLDPLLC